MKSTTLALSLLSLLDVSAGEHSKHHHPARNEKSARTAGASSGMHGITYSPYNADSSCKSKSQIVSDWAGIASQYGVVRLYGVDCDQVANVYQVIKEHNYNCKLFLGLWNIKPYAYAADIKMMAAGIDNNWDVVDTVALGNEPVNSGQATAEEMVSNLSQAKSALKSAGYNGPVVLVDTCQAVTANPTLCTASDYCACNYHAFFDSNCLAKDAGTCMTNKIGEVKKLIGNKRVRVTESGWPTQGLTNGVAVPSHENQAAALASLKAAASSPEDLMMYNMVNDMWKTSSAVQFQAEKYWGIKNNS